MNRREFFQSSLKAGVGAFFSVGIMQKAFGSNSAPQQIKVNLPSYEVQLLEKGQWQSSYACRVGAPSAQTPIGTGRILKKRDQVVFRYLSGPQEGEVIERTYLDPLKKWEPMPYDRMKGMDFAVNGRMTGAVFHSTTDYWTIGTPKSHGCIGLRIEDMLQFYDEVYYPLPDLEIGYQTIFYNMYKDEITFWCDIYNRGTNKDLSHLYNLIGFPKRQTDEAIIRNNLSKIDDTLNNGHNVIQKILRRGEDPSNELHRLSFQISRDQLLWWKL